MGDATVIADTNLFFECGKISELDWSMFPYEQINIIVCKPVQTEIDKHKKENGRAKRKAIAWSKIFREMLLLDVFEKEEKESNPKIILKLDATTKPSEVLSGEIDYNTNDNKIVGIAKSYYDELGDGVFLLSHDTGPIATAKSVNVPYKFIPEDWISVSTEDPELTKLRAENQKFKKQEPKIEISFEKDDNGKVNFEEKNSAALSEGEIESLVEKIKDKHPVKTDFRTPERQSPVLGRGMNEYVPPNEREVDKYIYEKYPSWVKRCEDKFVFLHRSIVAAQGPKIIEIQAANTGSRPAEMARVIITASGDVKFRRKKLSNDDDEDGDGIFQVEMLPPPPTPPQGKWENILTRSLAGIGVYESILNSRSGLNISHPPLRVPDFPHIDNRRDPDGFYWCDPIPKEFTDYAELECENWRHNRDAEVFVLEVQPCKNRQEGAITYTFLANNLTDRKSVTVPIRFEHVTVDTLQYAERQISLIR